MWYCINCTILQNKVEARSFRMHEFVGEIFLGENVGNYQPPIPRKTSDVVRHRAGGMLAGLRGLETAPPREGTSHPVLPKASRLQCGKRNSCENMFVKKQVLCNRASHMKRGKKDAEYSSKRSTIVGI